MKSQKTCGCCLLRALLTSLTWLGTSCQLLETGKVKRRGRGDGHRPHNAGPREVKSLTLRSPTTRRLRDYLYFTSGCAALCYHMVLAVAMTSAQATSAATTTTTRILRPDSRCSVDDGVVADESRCSGFIICLKGQARPLQCSRDLLFNRDKFTCDFPSRVDCDERSKDADESSCYTAMINVTVLIRNEIKDPHFQAKVTLRCPRQPLRYILLMAAGKDTRFRYETQNFQGFGDYVSSINGVSNDVMGILAVWQPHNRKGEVISENVDEYIPENNEAISFQYKSAIPMG